MGNKGRKKISIIGAGNVGASAALWIASKGLGDVVLVDIVEGLPQGKALDLGQALPVLGQNNSVTGSNKYDETKDSDVVVITAGKIRTAEMTREDLYHDNTKILTNVLSHVCKASPNSILIIVTNPLDVMVHLALQQTGFPRHRVMGMAGCLDSTRLRYFIAQELCCNPAEVHAMVIGSHNEDMVPVLSNATVNGKPVEKLLSKEKLAKAVEATRHAGKAFLPLMKTTAYVAPGIAIAEMVEAIVNDKHCILPVSTFLDGEYHQKGIVIGVPCVLGKKGIERVIELPLTKEEQAQFEKCCDDVKSLIKQYEGKK